MSEQQRARTAVARLEMLSNGSCRNYNSDGRGGTGNAMPQGVHVKKDGSVVTETLDFESFRRRLNGCTTERDFGSVADAADVAWVAWTVSPKPPRDSLAWREMLAADTRKSSVIAKQYGISRQSVWLIRKAHGEKAA